MKHVYRLLGVSLFLSALSCSNAVPVSTGANISFGKPKFSNGQTQQVFNINNFSDPVTVAGTCDPLTEGIEISLDAGVNWVTPFQGVDLDCKGDGAFSLTFSDCSANVVTGGLGDYPVVGSHGFVNSADHRSIEIKLRSRAALGASQESTFFIQYGNSMNLRFAGFNAGATGSSTQTLYKVKGLKVGALSGASQIDSTNYKLKFSGGN